MGSKRQKGRDGENTAKEAELERILFPVPGRVVSFDA